MSMVEQPVPMGEQEQMKGMDGAQEKEEQQKSSYRDSLPGAPKPICSTEPLDESIFSDLYAMMGQQPPKNVEQPSNESAPPALPERSKLRASRLLDSFGLNLAAPQPASLNQATPHDVYLSSEEDASSEADDFSDYDYDSEAPAEQTAATATAAVVAPVPVRRRKSHEDTARVVSMIFVGRPSIVTISPSRRSISPNSLEARSRQDSSAEHSRSASPMSSTRRRSTSSISTASFQHPPRTSSKLTGLLHKPRPLFLNIDPFASKPESPTAHAEEHETPKTPKTPTAMFKRTMSLVRKRSRPALNLQATQSQTNLAAVPVGPANETLDSNATTTTTPTHTPSSMAQRPMTAAPGTEAVQSPVTYHDIMKSAKKNAQQQALSATTAPPMSPIPQSPKSPPISSPAASASRRVFSFAMNRRRSIKAT